MGMIALMHDYILKIINSRSIDDIKSHVSTFLSFIENNETSRKEMCGSLAQAIVETGKPYMKRSTGSANNAVIIPPEHAPVLMIPTCVTMMFGTDAFFAGLHKFLERCGEFSAPKEAAVTDDEINLVLGAAQRKFGIMDIIAFYRPLMIVRLNNSHRVYNCECGITDTPGNREAVIFIYHPNDVSVYDRVFIFAHELGHALHKTLTGDVDVIYDYLPAGPRPTHNAKIRSCIIESNNLSQFGLLSIIKIHLNL